VKAVVVCSVFGVKVSYDGIFNSDFRLVLLLHKITLLLISVTSR